MEYIYTVYFVQHEIVHNKMRSYSLELIRLPVLVKRKSIAIHH
jgi:hypothetical protein